MRPSLPQDARAPTLVAAKWDEGFLILRLCGRTAPFFDIMSSVQSMAYRSHSIHSLPLFTAYSFLTHICWAGWRGQLSASCPRTPRFRPPPDTLIDLGLGTRSATTGVSFVTDGGCLACRVKKQLLKHQSVRLRSYSIVIIDIYNRETINHTK